jgi:hypothetical protein
MDRALGAALTGAGALGYLAGVLAPYPGRALSLPAVMIGVALLAAGGVMADRDGEDAAAEREAAERETAGGEAGEPERERGGAP